MDKKELKQLKADLLRFSMEHDLEMTIEENDEVDVVIDILREFIEEE